MMEKTNKNGFDGFQAASLHYAASVKKLLNEPHQLTGTANDGSEYVIGFIDGCDSLQWGRLKRVCFPRPNLSLSPSTK